MVEIFNINDLYLLRLHARQQGYEVKDYVDEARRLGITIPELIKSAHKNQNLFDLCERNERFAHNFNRGLVGIVVATVLFSIGYMVSHPLSNADEVKERCVEFYGKPYDAMCDSLAIQTF